MPFEPPIPVLRIFSADKAREFYVDQLRFAWDWEQRARPDFPLYAQVSRGDLVLHLSEHHGNATPGAAVFIPTSDIDSLLAELAGRPYAQLQPVTTVAGWGRELLLTDPFGNRLRFCERHGAAQPAPAEPPAQGLTRAQVRAEYLKARAEGTLPPDGEVG